MRFRLVSVCAFVALVAALLAWGGAGEDRPALAASKTVTDAVTVIKSDVGWSLRLRAFEVLRKEGTADAIAELVKLTEHESLRVSTMACTTLARMKKDAAKAKLKTIIENTSEKAPVRLAAMNALARQGTLADRAWIDSKAKSDPKLSGQLSVLKKMSLWKN